MSRCPVLTGAWFLSFNLMLTAPPRVGVMAALLQMREERMQTWSMVIELAGSWATVETGLSDPELRISTTPLSSLIPVIACMFGNPQNSCFNPDPQGAGIRRQGLRG